MQSDAPLPTGPVGAPIGSNQVSASALFGAQSPEAGTTESQDERMDRLRAAYSTTFNDVMDRVLEEVILPTDKLALLADAVQLFTFLMIVKMAEVNRQAGERQALLTAFWQLHAGNKNEIPGRLREYAELYEKALQQGA